MNNKSSKDQANDKSENDRNTEPESTLIVPELFRLRDFKGFLWPIIPVVGAEVTTLIWLFHKNPFMWYIHNGPALVLLFGLVSIGLDLDRYPDIISLNPNAFYRETRRIAGTFINVLGFAVEGKEGSEFPEDFWLGMPLAVLLVLASVAWLFLIMPMAYFTFAIFGAPTRMALHTTTGLKRDAQDFGIIWTNVRSPMNYPVMTINLLSKPVTATAALSAVSLEVLSRILGG